MSGPRPRISGIRTVAAMVVLAPAGAVGQQPQALEMHLSADVLATLVHRLADAHVPCSPDLDCPAACVVDRIDFDPDNLLVGHGLSGPVQLTAPGKAWIGSSTVIVTPTRVHVPAAYHCKAESCAADPDCALEEYVATENRIMWVDLSVVGDSLCGTAAAFGFARCIDLDVDLELVADDTPPVAGMAFDPGTQRAAVRWDYAPIQSGPAWQAFHSGDLATVTAPGDAHLFVSEPLLRAAVRRRLAANLDGALTDGVHVVGDISAAWLPLHDAAILSLNIPLGKWQFPCPVRLRTDIDVATVFSFDGATSVLKYDVHIAANRKTATFVACGLTPFNLVSPQVLAPSITTVVAYAIAGGRIKGALDTLDISADCTLVTSSLHHCETAVELPDMALVGPSNSYTARFDLTQMRATAEGLHWGATAHIGPPARWMEVTIGDPVFHGPSCGSNFMGFEGGIHLRGQTESCDVSFDPGTTQGWGITEQVPFAFNHSMARYRLRPDLQMVQNGTLQELRFTVATTAGIKTYAVPPPEPEPGLDHELWSAHAEIQRTIRCYRFTTAFNEMWTLDPWINPWERDPGQPLDPLRNRMTRIMTAGGEPADAAAIVDLRFELQDGGVWLLGNAFVEDAAGELSSFPLAVQVFSPRQVGRQRLEVMIERALDRGIDTSVPVPAELGLAADRAVLVVRVGRGVDQDAATWQDAWLRR